jgi:mono/diheme cytochrome c family protein
MMKSWIAGASVLVALIMAGAQVAAAAGEAAAGKAVYAKKCGTCHGDTGEGKPAIAKMMKVELRALGSSDVQALSDENVTQIITAGKEKMKPVQGLSPADVANVIAYFRTLPKP